MRTLIDRSMLKWLLAVALVLAFGYYVVPEIVGRVTYAQQKAEVEAAEEQLAKLGDLSKALARSRQRQWTNLGGQLIPADDFATLRADIKAGKLTDWLAIHAAYDALWEDYPLAKQRHAHAALRDLLGVDKLTRPVWFKALAEAVRIQDHICEQVYLSRKKDYDNPFRQATFANAEEMKAVVGTIEGNSFVKQTRKETKAFKKRIQAVRRRT